MKAEPLRNKLCIDGYEEDASFMKEDVKSAVEFYKRYHDDVYSSEGYELLKKEKPEIYKQFINYLMAYKLCACIYNYWLYEYCFKDVIE